MKSWVNSHRLLATGLVIVLVSVGVLLVWVETSRAPTPTDGGQMPTTIEGEIVCLPHKDTNGPRTLECAYGVKLSDSTYYGLQDSNEKYENISRLPAGKRARLTGTLKLEQSDRYQSIGTFTVTDSKVLE